MCFLAQGVDCQEDDDDGGLDFEGDAEVMFCGGVAAATNDVDGYEDDGEDAVHDDVDHFGDAHGDVVTCLHKPVGADVDHVSISNPTK